MAGIFRVPPPTFVGGAQPYAPKIHVTDGATVQVDDPPLNARQRVNLGTIAVAWRTTPAPTQRTYHFTIAIDDPPFGRRPLPTPWPASVVPKQRAAAFAIAIDDPPVGGRPSLAPVLLWRRELPRIGPRAFVVQEAITTADDPPFGERSLSPVLAHWQRASTRTSARTFAVIEPPAQVDDPPFSVESRVILGTVVASWRAPAPPVRHFTAVVQEGPAASIDEPPYGQRLWMATTLRAWQPGPPKPQQLGRFVVQTNPTILWMWKRIS